MLLMGFTIFYQLSNFGFLYIEDKQSVNLHGHVNVTKDAAAEISKGISAVGSNIGLGGTIVGVASAVGKVIVKSGMPPMQKASVVLAGSMVGGITHSMISRHNKNEIIHQNPSDHIGSICKNINKFLDNDSYTPLEGMLYDIQIMSITLLGLVGILIIQLIIRLHAKEEITLRLHKFIGLNLNKKLQYYTNKIIILNKRMSTIYVWLIIIILVIGLSAILLANTDLFNNLDKYIYVHKDLKK